ncbi:MAG: pyridoxamine 5'-phosphate oxidase family protein, partial [Actinomycetota bacterium]
MPEQRDLRDLRVHYDMGTLSEADLAPSPLQQFRAWFAEAAVAGLAEANAMVVATVSPDGVPSARTVLLKDVDARGFAFYTNLTSRKGAELAAT